MQLYGQIEKCAGGDDGSIIVSGYASTSAIDGAGDIIVPDAIAKAVESWRRWGNIREMHQMSAVGTAVSAEMRDDKLWLEARIIDPLAIAKCKAGVYKGFSIGGRVIARDPADRRKITKMALSEISIVDQPENRETGFSLAKAAMIQKGVGSAAEFANLVQALIWFAGSVADESIWEGDASDMPGRISDWVRAGLPLVQALMTEELTEAMNDLAAIVGKVPAKPSTEVEAVVVVEAEDVAKAAGEQLAKAQGARDAAGVEIAGHITRIHTLETERDEAIAKAAGFETDLQAATRRAEEAEAKYAKLAATPVPGGPILKAAGAVLADPEPHPAARAEAQRIAALAPDEKAVEFMKLAQRRA